jgi:hypothetical protein
LWGIFLFSFNGKKIWISLKSNRFPAKNNHPRKQAGNPAMPRQRLAFEPIQPRGADLPKPPEKIMADSRWH